MWRQILPEVISHGASIFHHKRSEKSMFHSLFQNFRVRNMVLEIERSIYTHHVQLPSLTFFERGGQNSFLDINIIQSTWSRITSGERSWVTSQFYIPGHDTPPRYNSAIHGPFWESISDFEPSFQQAIQPAFFFWSLDPPLVTIAQVGPVRWIDVISQRRIVEPELPFGIVRESSEWGRLLEQDR